MLNKKIAQIIVSKTMSVIDFDVNIMDADAYIIASANKNRIGDFHPGADKVIRSGKSLSINIKQASEMKGVREGITLPIEFNKKIIGAVGIKGEPDLVIKYGELVKYTTELMVEQTYIKEIVYLESRSKSNFLNELLTGNWIKNNENLVERGLALGIDINKRYLILAGKIKFNNYKGEKIESESMLKFERFKDRLEKKITMNIYDYPNIITGFINDYLTIMIPIYKNKSFINDYRLQYKISNRIFDIIKNELEQEVVLGIGGVNNDWKDMYKKFENAIFSIKMGGIVREKKDIESFIDYITEYNLSFIPIDLRDEYIDKVLGKLLIEKNSYVKESLYTLKRYFYFDMSIKETSEDLFIHRNTLMSRLNRIEKITGYRPQNFKDAFFIRIAIMMLNLKDIDVI